MGDSTETPRVMTPHWPSSPELPKYQFTKVDPENGTAVAGGYGGSERGEPWGWAEIAQGLGDPDAGLRPTMFIHRRCARLLECLPSLQHDPNRPEDVLKVDADEEGIGGDDAADACRYLVATKGRELRLRKLSGL